MGALSIGKIRRSNGVAGQVSYSVDVTYPDEPTSRVEFVGSTYGGPVVMVTNSGQTFVVNPGRFGEFGPDWVRRFFGVDA
jgi:hypothetical protein